MNIVAIIQARMTSTRLPGKVLKQVLNKPLLEYQLERVKRSKYLDSIVIATTTKLADQPIIEFCERLKLNYFRGSLDDVLSRYYSAAKEFNADIIVRLTSDCPIIDPKVIDQVIRFYLINSDKYDYVSNSLTRTFPRGMDTEVFTFSALEQAYYNASEKYEREHVTPYIYEHKERFNLASIEYLTDQSSHRWTVDTEEDLSLISKVIESLYPNNDKFTLEDTLQLLASKPDWQFINNQIEQKKLGE